jgi:hypothetical protein
MPVDTVIAGLGGRSIRQESLLRMLAGSGPPNGHEPGGGTVTFLDLHADVVARELARMEARRDSGPAIRNILRESPPPGTHVH